MCFGQIRRQRQRPFGLGQRALEVAAEFQGMGETRMGIRIGDVKRHRAASRSFGQLLRFEKPARLKIARRIQLRPGEAAVSAGKGLIELHRPPKISLSESSVPVGSFAHSPGGLSPRRRTYSPWSGETPARSRKISEWPLSGNLLWMRRAAANLPPVPAGCPDRSGIPGHRGTGWPAER